MEGFRGFLTDSGQVRGVIPNGFSDPDVVLGLRSLSQAARLLCDDAVLKPRSWSSSSGI